MKHSKRGVEYERFGRQQRIKQQLRHTDKTVYVLYSVLFAFFVALVLGAVELLMA